MTQDPLTNLQHYTGRLAEGQIVKIALAALAVFAQSAGAAWAATPELYRGAVALVMLDWITGFGRSLIVGNNTSKRNRQGAFKAVEYFSLLGLAYLLGMIGGPVLSVAPVFAATIVGVTEGTSLLENLRDIAKHFGADENPLISALIKLGRLSPEKLIETVINAQTGGTGPLVTTDGGADVQKPDGASQAPATQPLEEGEAHVGDPRHQQATPEL